MKETETELENQGEAAPVSREEVAVRQGSRTNVNLVILLVSTLAAAVALAALLAPGLRL